MPDTKKNEKKYDLILDGVKGVTSVCAAWFWAVGRGFS